MRRKLENTGSSRNFLCFNEGLSSHGNTISTFKAAPIYFVIISLMILFLLFPFSSALCQIQGLTPEEIKRHGGDYIWGEGRGRDRGEAREKAIDEMAQNVRVTVSSSFESVLREEGGESQDFIKSVVNVNYGATFNDLQPIFWQEDGEDVALCYIHKDKLQEVYDEQKEEIITMYQFANNNLEEMDISTALQLYYYCLILMNALPDRTIDFHGDNLKIVIPAKIKNVLNNIKIEHKEDIRNDETERAMELSVSYNGNSVQSLEFMYLSNGREEKCVVMSGIAYCELYGPTKQYSRLDVDIEYRFAAERDAFPSVKDLWEHVNKPHFNNNKRINLDKKETKPPPFPQEEVLPSLGSLVAFKKETDCPEQEINKEYRRFIEVIKGGQKAVSAYADDEFLERKLTNALKYNKIKMMSENFQVDINKTWDGWELRRIPVSCYYPTISTRTVEYIVLDFDEEGTLKDFNFVVFDKLYHNEVNPDIYSEEEVLQRQVIVKFLEKYRTAYLNRDMEALEKIFAEEAVIIVGRLLKESESNRHYELDRGLGKVTYQRFDKKQYLERQKGIFARQRDIHLGFNSFKIRKKDADTNVYGISMRQQYASSGYSDEGHLFLLVDFIEDDPKIHVRNWQPYEWSEEEMDKMGNYRLLK